MPRKSAAASPVTAPDAPAPAAVSIDTTPSPPAVTVAQLLEQSRAHATMRATLANRRTGPVPTPDYVGATAAAQRALDTRHQAHQLDPEHSDPSWALDLGQHATIVAFLERYLARP